MENSEDAVDRLKLFQDNLELEIDEFEKAENSSNPSLPEALSRGRGENEEDVDDVLEAGSLTSTLSAFESSFTSPNKQFMKLSEKSKDDDNTPSVNSFFDSPVFGREELLGSLVESPAADAGGGRGPHARVEFTSVTAQASSSDLTDSTRRHKLIADFTSHKHKLTYVGCSEGQLDGRR